MTLVLPLLKHAGALRVDPVEREHPRPGIRPRIAAKDIGESLAGGVFHDRAAGESFGCSGSVVSFLLPEPTFCPDSGNFATISQSRCAQITIGVLVASWQRAAD